MRLRSQSGEWLTLGNTVATRGGLVRSGSWCVWVTMGARAPPSERTEKIGKLGSVLYYTILTSGIILTFHTFKEEINDDAGGGSV